VTQNSNINIIIQARNLASRVLNQLRGDVNTFATRFRSALFSIQGAFASAGIALGLGAIVRGIFSANVEFQRLTAQLRTFTGSQDAANQKFKELQQLAIDLPFELRDITQSWINLRGAGIEATTEMLEAFSNVAVSAQGNIAELGEAVRAALTGEFERLKRFNIVARADGDKLNITYQGMTKSIDRTAEAVAGFLVQLGRTEFAGASIRQMQMLDGQISNLKDSLFKLMTQIGEAGATGAMGDLVVRMNELTKAMIEADGAVIKWTRTILAIGNALVQTVVMPLRLVVNTITTLWHTGTLLHVTLSQMANRFLHLTAVITRNKDEVKLLNTEYMRLDEQRRRVMDSLIQDGNDSFAAVQNLGQAYRDLWNEANEEHENTQRRGFEGRTAREKEIEQLRTNIALNMDRKKTMDRLLELEKEIVTIANTRGDAEGRLGRQLQQIAQIKVEAAEADKKGAANKKTLVEQLEDEINARIALAELMPKNLDNLVKLVEIEGKLQAELKKKNLELTNEVELRKALLEVQKAIIELGLPLDKPPKTLPMETDDRIPGGVLPPKAPKPEEKGGSALDELGKAIENTETLEQVMADMITGVFQDFGDAISNAFAAFATGSATAGQAFKRAMLGALAAVAKGFAEFYLKQALAKLALRDFAAAAKLTAAAIGLFALAGALGGFASGGGGGGGGGAGDSPRGDVDGTAKQDSYLIIEGGFLDMNDPRQEESLRKALEQLSGRRVIVMGDGNG
jgi:hypothetical protein